MVRSCRDRRSRRSGAPVADRSPREAELLRVFAYGDNETVLHRDESLMPRRKRVWASWNLLSGAVRAGWNAPRKPCVTYWMNRLQPIADPRPYFVTLSPLTLRGRQGHLARTLPASLFNAETLASQKQLWSLQGKQIHSFCGSYFGSGFHEDAIQAGLAVGESLGGVARPWSIAGDSDRIFRTLQPAKDGI